MMTSFSTWVVIGYSKEQDILPQEPERMIPWYGPDDTAASYEL